MRTIYAISSGSYSDYRVLAVCEVKATAEAWAKALQEESDGYNTDAEVEDMRLLEPAEPVEKQHRVSLRQELRDEGSEDRERLTERDEYLINSLWGEVPKQPSVRFVRAPMHRGKGGRLEIEGRTRAAVMKVWSEQHAVWKSSPRTYRVPK